MSLIIDGHNLIPHLPGMDLADQDDEEKLIALLGEYSRLRRKSIEVYFDRAPLGQARERNYGKVKAVFVQEGSSADAAIMARLKKMGKRAKNVRVISSDRQVQQAARAAHAEVQSSQDFAAEWLRLSEEENILDPRNRSLSEEEITNWEALFRGNDTVPHDEK
ncbi:MAG: NYN domain-containing protein [Anaerolineales bacterium]